MQSQLRCSVGHDLPNLQPSLKIVYLNFHGRIRVREIRSRFFSDFHQLWRKGKRVRYREGINPAIAMNLFIRHR
jgi:hypothetical protein